MDSSIRPKVTTGPAINILQPVLTDDVQIPRVNLSVKIRIAEQVRFTRGKVLNAGKRQPHVKICLIDDCVSRQIERGFVCAGNDLADEGINVVHINDANGDANRDDDDAIASILIDSDGDSIPDGVEGAVGLDPLDTDLARMRVMNEVLEDGEKAFGEDFLERINEVAQSERGQRFRKIQDVVIRPSADLGVLAGQVLQNMEPSRARSPILRLAKRNAESATSTDFAAGVNSMA